MAKKHIVVVEVLGGVVQEIYVKNKRKVRVIVVDHDNIRDGDIPHEFSCTKLKLIPAETLDLIYDTDIPFPSL